MLFAQHIQLDCTTNSTHTAFPSFGKLPIELQIHVLRFCSRATFFRLMQTSATLRREASKLFWSDPDCWYRIDGAWLLAGGFAGEAPYATNFLCWVQQIEIIFADIRNLMGLDDIQETKEEDRPSPKEDQRICDFWRLVRCHFPKAVRVVISENTPRRTRSVSLNAIQQVVQGCPNGTEVFVSITSSGDGTTGTAIRYRARFNESDRSWEVMEADWVRQGIMPPAKAWRGIVGEHARSEYENERYVGIKRAREILVTQAIERSYFGGQGGEFQCSDYRCSDHFVDGRESAAHAVGRGHYIYAKVPIEYKEQFARHEEMVIKGFKESVYEAQKRIGERYSKAGDAEKREMKEVFLEQLRSDADYLQSKLVEESDIWKLFRVNIGDAKIEEVFRS